MVHSFIFLLLAPPLDGAAQNVMMRLLKVFEIKMERGGSEVQWNRPSNFMEINWFFELNSLFYCYTLNLYCCNLTLSAPNSKVDPQKIKEEKNTEIWPSGIKNIEFSTSLVFLVFYSIAKHSWLSDRMKNRLNNVKRLEGGVELVQLCTLIACCLIFFSPLTVFLR